MKQLLRSIVPGRVRLLLAAGGRVEHIEREVVELRSMVEDTRRVVMSLNHHLIHGGPSGMPLLIDVAERMRTDADASIGAVSAMERSLHVVEQRLAAVADRLEHLPARDA